MSGHSLQPLGIAVWGLHNMCALEVCGIQSADQVLEERLTRPEEVSYIHTTEAETVKWHSNEMCQVHWKGIKLSRFKFFWLHILHERKQLIYKTRKCKKLLQQSYKYLQVIMMIFYIITNSMELSPS
jgi:hypothetical protein